MATLRPDVAPKRGSTTASGAAQRGLPAGLPAASEDTAQVATDVVELHESMATLFASRGRWLEAYEHLRIALDLCRAQHEAEVHDQVRIPEQWRREVDRLRREHAEAREQSLRDSLTRTYNRRYLDQHLVGLLTDQAGKATKVAVALVDLDWFKNINDTYGHLVGDRVLQRVVELLCTDLPEGAFCARYGGEEFALVLPQLDARAAVSVCEAARERVERHPWHELAAGLQVTVSAGVALECSPSALEATEHQLRRADSLLYAAKRSGRNAVAYRSGGRVRLAGRAADRRSVANPAAAAPAQQWGQPLPTWGPVKGDEPHP